MDFDAISDNLPLFLLIIGIILVQFLLRRRRRPEVTYREITQSLLAEVRLNQALVETFSLREKPKRFEMTS
jgi:cytochrome c-type biogenesis protein CcmH/NrfF